MQPRDIRVYLLDARTAAECIAAIALDVGATRLRADPLVKAAIERHLITLGEALAHADQLDPSLEFRIPYLPAIIGLRNRLVHGYFAIKWDRIVMMVESDLTPLLCVLREIAE